MLNPRELLTRTVIKLFATFLVVLISFSLTFLKPDA